MSSHVSYHAVAASRAKELAGRLGFGLLAALAAAYVTQTTTWPAAWLVAVIFTQLLGHRLAEPMRRDAGFVPSPAYEALYLGAIALGGVVFAAVQVRVPEAGAPARSGAPPATSAQTPPTRRRGPPRTARA